jgi:hypothetical protein
MSASEIARILHPARDFGRLCGHGRQQFADAKNIERPSQIIDEGVQTELGADFSSTIPASPFFIGGSCPWPVGKTIPRARTRL